MGTEKIDKPLDNIKNHEIDWKSLNDVANAFYHEQHRKNEIKESALCEHDFSQVFLPKEPGKTGFFEWFILNAIRSYTQVVPIMRPYSEFIPSSKEDPQLSPSRAEKIENLKEYELFMKDILNKLHSHSVLFVSDHNTFAGILILISEIYKYAAIYGKQWVVDNIYTVLGFALMTQSQKKVILPISNVLTTMTNTDNAKIPGLSIRDASKMRANFREEFLERSAKPGNIFFLAPTGKRDLLERSPNGMIKNIYFGDDTIKNIKSARDLVRDFSAQGNQVVLAGVNETNLKDPTQVKEKGNDRSKGNTYVSLKSLTLEDIDAMIAEKTCMSTLASLVKDRNGYQIGHACGAEILKVLTEEIESKSYEYILKEHPLSSLDFKDTLIKYMVRKLFCALKDCSERDIKSQIVRVLHKKS